MIGGCGTAADDETGGTAAVGTTTEPEPTETPTEARSIADALDADGRFETFLTLLAASRAPLVGEEGRTFLTILDDLEGRDWTVFAPTDAAFAALGDGALEELTTGPWLTGVMHRHMVPGTFGLADLETGPMRTDGGPVDVVVTEDTVVFGGATVSAESLVAANGLVHVIDGVVLVDHVRDAIGVDGG